MKALSKRSPRVKFKWTNFKAQIQKQAHTHAHFIFIIALVDNMSSTQLFFSNDTDHLLCTTLVFFFLWLKGCQKITARVFYAQKLIFLNFIFSQNTYDNLNLFMIPNNPKIQNQTKSKKILKLRSTISIKEKKT